MRILRIDMGGDGSDGPVASEEPLARYAGLGGRALASSIVADEVDPSIHPFDAGNRLVLAPGLLAGVEGSPADRMSLACKSPLTGGVAVSSAGGGVGPALARLGYAAVVVEGHPTGESLWTITIRRGGTSASRADGCRGLDPLSTLERLRADHGGAAFVTIGSAGEDRNGASSIACTGVVPAATRHLAGGGVGAVLGSKRVKAIVVDDRGVPARRARMPERFRHAAALLPGDPHEVRARGAETLWTHCQACAIDDGEAIADLQRMYDALGLDAVETGAAIGVAMTAGLARFGDAQGAAALIDEIRRGTPLGRILGAGAEAAARALGVERAVCPRMTPGGDEGKEGSPSAALVAAALDCLGVSLWAADGTAVARLDAILDELAGALGGTVASESARGLGAIALHRERAFAARAGVVVGDAGRRRALHRSRAAHQTIFRVDDRTAKVLAALGGTPDARAALSKD